MAFTLIAGFGQVAGLAQNGFALPLSKRYLFGDDPVAFGAAKVRRMILALLPLHVLVLQWPFAAVAYHSSSFVNVIVAVRISFVLVKQLLQALFASLQ